MKKIIALCLLLIMSAAFAVANCGPPRDHPSYSIEKSLKATPVDMPQVIAQVNPENAWIFSSNTVNLPFIRAVSNVLEPDNRFMLQQLSFTFYSGNSDEMRFWDQSCNAKVFWYPIKPYISGIPVPFHHFSQPFS